MVRKYQTEITTCFTAIRYNLKKQKSCTKSMTLSIEPPCKFLSAYWRPWHYYGIIGWERVKERTYQQPESKIRWQPNSVMFIPENSWGSEGNMYCLIACNILHSKLTAVYICLCHMSKVSARHLRSWRGLAMSSCSSKPLQSSPVRSHRLELSACK